MRRIHRIKLFALFAAALSLPIGCRDTPVDPNLTTPTEVVLYPAVGIDLVSTRILPDSEWGDVVHLGFYHPDTMVVLAAGDAWPAFAQALTRESIGRRPVPTVGVSQALSWESDNTSVASVDRAGVITARSAGTARIRVTSRRDPNASDVGIVKVLPQHLQFQQIAVGGMACGLDATSAAYCWGGDPGLRRPPFFTVEDVGPYRVTSTEPLATISIGEAEGFPRDIGQGCALTASGRALCWSVQYSGAGPSRSELVGGGTRPFGAGMTFKAIAAGARAVCALDAGGSAYCSGQLFGLPPAGGTFNSSTVTAIAGGLHFNAIAVGGSACGIVDDGTAYCWNSTPIAVSNTVKFTQLAVAGTYACGISAAADAYCWGTAVGGGLGLGTVTSASAPTMVPGGFKFASISASTHRFEETCALTLDGAGYCWGVNVKGALGTGTTSPANTPTKISSSLRFSAIQVGAYRGCGLADGKTYCWGAMFGHRTATSLIPTLMEAQPR